MSDPLLAPASLPVAFRKLPLCGLELLEDGPLTPAVVLVVVVVVQVVVVVVVLEVVVGVEVTVLLGVAVV